MAYLVGTLGGAAVMPQLGRTIDIRGSRTAMALTASLEESPTDARYLHWRVGISVSRSGES